MSLSHKGKKFTDEHRRNLTLSMIGRKRTERSIRLQSERMKGKPSPMKGRKHSEASLEKLRNSLKGRIFTQEYKDNMRRVAIERNLASHFPKGKPPWNKGMKGVHKYAKRGAESPNWKGGKLRPLLMLRASVEYEIWRHAVLSRDNWTCQKYKIRGGVLHAHHILNFKDHPELRFAIDNGICLSKKAHWEFHLKYGRSNNTKEQLDEFLSTNPAECN